MKTKIFELERVIVICLLLVVITRIRLLNFITYENTFLNLMIISFFLFSIVGIFGLIFKKNWGFFATYLFIMISSLGFGISPIPIPYIQNMLSVQTVNYIIFILSAILFLFTLFLHLKKLRIIK